MTHKVTNKNKVLKHYVIGGLIMNSDNIFGRARELIELFGTYAFGGVEDQWNIQGHHEESKNNPSRLYDH